MEYYQFKHKISVVKYDCPESDNPDMLNDGIFGMAMSENVLSIGFDSQA